MTRYRTRTALAALLALAIGATGCGAGTGGTASAAGKGDTVTVYSADGLGDWYKAEFAKFTKATGVKVNYVEAGSSEVVGRVEKERNNPQADVLVTLPPFIQQADKDGMLDKLGTDTGAIAAADKAGDGTWTALVNNYSCFIANSTAPAPKTWDDLLASSYRGKLQYSTPGQAGDGTALLYLLQHEMGEQGALAYLKRLQASNVGPSASTGALQPKVSSGSLLVANGDVQMNLASIQADKSNFGVVFPRNGAKKPETVALPYAIARTKGAPNAANGEKLTDFLLSAAEQKTVSSGAFGYPVRTDVHPSDANFAELQKTLKGVTVYHPDWDSILGGLKSDIDAYTEATS